MMSRQLWSFLEFLPPYMSIFAMPLTSSQNQATASSSSSSFIFSFSSGSATSLRLCSVIVAHTNTLICICLAGDAIAATAAAAAAVWRFSSGARPANYTAVWGRTLIRTVCATGGRQLERKT